ncbi:hypothetical protein BZG36_04755 [Bifiguratus adelaidae]|uniref:Ubiquitin domain-containing protein DSK2 n=1 Tax=Bifiguratus adelaidae TaxID=1938954 RepID=A0A261XUZ2_9FUNG|nr:hypothetical protein BZG36_04755 [Bifiguratus adelaidae]
MAININVKCSNDTKYVIAIEPSKTVLEFKQAIAEQSDTPAERQRLIYSGRVLKDADTLESYKVQDGHTVHMVRGAGASSNASATSNTSSAIPGPQTNTSTATTTAANTAPASNASQNPYAALGGNMINPWGMGSPNAANSNPFGAMGDMGGMGMDPALMSQMLQNPAFAQYMSSMLQNPDVIESVIAQNPQLAAMAPGLRETMQSPQFRQMISNPQYLQQMAQFSAAMQSMGMAPNMGGFGTPTTTPNTATNQPGTPSTPAPQNPFAALAPPTGTQGSQPGNTTNPFAFDPNMMQQMMAAFGAGNPTSAPADTRPPEERFQVQLQQLNEMGFWDAARNIQALQRCGGNVNAAIEMLLNGTI